MAPLDEIQVGDVVNVPGGMYGTVKYLGGVSGKPGKFAGIELSAEHARRGKNNGDVEGRKYFVTSVPGSGIFVPMNNNKYVTKRSTPNFASSTIGSNPPTTPSASRPVNFSKSIGPGVSAPRTPRVTTRPSLPRAESPRGPPPSKLNLTGLRTPSSAARTVSSANGYPRSPVKAPSRASDRPSSRVSAEEDIPSARTSDFRRPSSSGEVQELRGQVKNLEKELMERDKQLDEQANTLADFQRTLEELEGSDALSIRAQLREKNDRIAQLTAEFDLHRADFRSTLDTLEIAASETERVYEQRLDELMQQNRELQDRGEDVEAVARQLKQLEELVSELEEGLEDARRGEAEARAEVEFLRGEVERTKLELDKERESAAARLQDAHTAPDSQQHTRDLEQKDDEIRGLKAIIHSLSRGEPNVNSLQQNGLGAGSQSAHDPEHVAHLEERVQEYEQLTERKTYRIEELERELQRLQVAGGSRTRSSTVNTSYHKPTDSTGKTGAPAAGSHSRRLSDRTVVPSDWSDRPENDEQYRGYSPQHHRKTSSQHRLETMHESDGRSDDGGSLWCEICETGGHDILSCTNMFGAEQKKKGAGADGPGHDMDKPTRRPSAAAETAPATHEHDTTPQKTSRDAVMDGLRSASQGLTSSMPPVAGKSSGVLDASKWCALCERDGHESIDCPFDD
ncbi:hypothetical protein BDV59DRAFT_135993 [Aspergillus ambiguus]|uniref:CAP-Gly domain containing linker protein BIK1 n=1 Tax=Aspergillus ambiguus TaxID=176160 RepID=UPI003CCD20B5